MTANPRVLWGSPGAPRHPQLGDMIVQTCVDGKYTCLVYEIERDRFAGSARVYIQWSGKEPSAYNRVHGYASSNIHNLRSEFQVIRQGAEIR